MWRLLSVGLLIAAATAGCSTKGGDVAEGTEPAAAGQAVAEQILAFHREGADGAPLELADITDFSWDAVHVFPEGTANDLVNETVGSTVVEGDGRLNQRGTFLVFTDGGQVRTSCWVVPLEISAEELSYGPDAALEAYSPDPGPYAVRFVR